MCSGPEWLPLKGQGCSSEISLKALGQIPHWSCLCDSVLGGSSQDLLTCPPLPFAQSQSLCILGFLSQRRPHILNLCLFLLKHVPLCCLENVLRFSKIHSQLYVTWVQGTCIFSILPKLNLSSAAQTFPNCYLRARSLRRWGQNQPEVTDVSFVLEMPSIPTDHW